MDIAFAQALPLAFHRHSLFFECFNPTHQTEMSGNVERSNPTRFVKLRRFDTLFQPAASARS